MLLGIWSNSCAAPAPIASLASVTAGSVSYSISIASAASRAAAKVSATTNATGWPTWRTLPSASTGRGVSCRGLPSRLMSGTVQGTSPRPSARTSSPVPTNSTPGMRRAAVASMRLICACATGERSTKACVIRRQHHVVGVAALPGDEPQILMPPHGLADAEFHAVSSDLQHLNIVSYPISATCRERIEAPSGPLNSGYRGRSSPDYCRT